MCLHVRYGVKSGHLVGQRTSPLSAISGRQLRIAALAAYYDGDTIFCLPRRVVLFMPGQHRRRTSEQAVLTSEEPAQGPLVAKLQTRGRESPWSAGCHKRTPNHISESRMLSLWCC